MGLPLAVEDAGRAHFISHRGIRPGVQGAPRTLAIDSLSLRLVGEVARKSAPRVLNLSPGHLIELDGLIASIARAHRFAVATRNVRNFEDCGLELLNPFEVP